MSETQKEVEDMKEFMTILTDVKVSMAELNGKIDQLTDIKESLQETKKTADNADYRSIENEKDIKEVKDNNRRITVALISIVGAFVLQIVFFMLTFNFN